MGFNKHLANAERPPSNESSVKDESASKLSKLVKEKSAPVANINEDSDSSEGDVAALFAQMRQKVAN